MATPRPSTAALRPSTLAHRWGGVVGDGIGALCAVGVRCDEADREKGQSLVVDVRPGRLSPRVPLPFTVRSVGGTATDPLFVDEADRALWGLEGGAPVKRLDGVVAIDGPLVLDRDGVVHRAEGHTLRPIARGARGVADGVIVGDDTLTLLHDDGRLGDTLPFVAPGVVRAVHRRGPQVGVYVDQTLHTLDLDSGARRAFLGPAEAHCLARGTDRWFIGCTVGGLLTLDDGDDRIRVFRPSLRAHQIARVQDGFVAVSDLTIAVSDDGHEWLGRDLAGLVRLFEHQ